MRIATAGLLGLTALLAAACGVQPGSPEWCKDVIAGKIKPSEAEAQAHGPACAQIMVKEMMNNLGNMQPPQQPGQ